MKSLKFLILALGLALGAGLWTTARAQSPASPPPPAQTPSDGVTRISLEEFKALIASGRPVMVIDVRGGIDRKMKGAVNIPLGDLESRLSEIPRDREIVTYCA